MRTLSPVETENWVNAGSDGRFLLGVLEEVSIFAVISRDVRSVSSVGAPNHVAEKAYCLAPLHGRFIIASLCSTASNGVRRVIELASVWHDIVSVHP